jgi:hypothetical protein
MSDDAYLSWYDKLLIAILSLALVLIFGTALALVTLLILIYG